MGRQTGRREGSAVLRVDRSGTLGPKYCTPQINTSEIIVDLQWHFPVDVQWHFPTEFHLSVAVPKDCHLSSGFSLELSDGCSVAFPDETSL